MALHDSKGPDHAIMAEELEKRTAFSRSLTPRDWLHCIRVDAPWPCGSQSHWPTIKSTLTVRPCFSGTTGSGEAALSIVCLRYRPPTYQHEVLSMRISERRRSTKTSGIRLDAIPRSHLYFSAHGCRADSDDQDTERVLCCCIGTIRLHIPGSRRVPKVRVDCCTAWEWDCQACPCQLLLLTAQRWRIVAEFERYGRPIRSANPPTMSLQWRRGWQQQ